MHTEFLSLPSFAAVKQFTEGPTMSELIPLTGNTGTTPVLALYGGCSYLYPPECAESRLLAARFFLVLHGFSGSHEKRTAIWLKMFVRANP